MNAKVFKSILMICMTGLFAGVNLKVREERGK
jgi:hypothetical protein